MKTQIVYKVSYGMLSITPVTIIRRTQKVIWLETGEKRAIKTSFEAYFDTPKAAKLDIINTKKEELSKIVRSQLYKTRELEEIISQLQSGLLKVNTSNVSWEISIKEARELVNKRFDELIDEDDL